MIGFGLLEHFEAGRVGCRWPASRTCGRGAGRGHGVAAGGKTGRARAGAVACPRQCWAAVGYAYIIPDTSRAQFATRSHSLTAGRGSYWQYIYTPRPALAWWLSLPANFSHFLSRDAFLQDVFRAAAEAPSRAAGECCRVSAAEETYQAGRRGTHVHR